ncbi:MAG: hypothetical protein WCY19_03290 [Candidatus Gastranaerophilaceae bacterium]
MKKIFSTLAVFVAVSCVMPAFACPQEKAEITTGAACSIAELNNLEKSKRTQEKFNLDPKGSKDLRPVRLVVPEAKTGDGCQLFGMCLNQNLGK